jgi:glutamate 5-kinase
MEILVYEPGKGLYERDVNPDYRARIGMGDAKNIVIKTGSDVLLTNARKFDRETIHSLLEQIVELMRGGKRVTLVSSGARVGGEEYIGGGTRKISARTLCTFGQPRLMDVYREIAGIWPDIKIGQGLLRDSDFQDKYRQSTKEGFDKGFEELEEAGIHGLLIVNANDFTWTGETKYDNDAMAANVHKLIGADLAIYLTNVDGLMSEFGTKNERVVSLVYGINNDIYGLVKDLKSKSGTGGLKPKLRRGIKKILDQRGVAVMANGKRRGVIMDILRGENIGTLFCRKEQIDYALT